MSQEAGPEVQGVPVTAGNWQDPPVNRWAFWHVDEILPTYRVSRGDGPARNLPRSPTADAVPSPMTVPPMTVPPMTVPRATVPPATCSRSR